MQAIEGPAFAFILAVSEKLQQTRTLAVCYFASAILQVFCAYM